MNASRTEILGRIRRSLDGLNRQQGSNRHSRFDSSKSLFTSDFVDLSKIAQRFKAESDRVGSETEICRNIGSAFQFIKSLTKNCILKS